MGGYVQKRRAAAKPPTDAEAQGIDARSATPGHADRPDDSAGQTPPRSLLQLRQALDGSPRVQQHAALQRALDQRAAAPAKRKSKEKPSLQRKGIAINDDAGLEREADVMAAQARALPQAAANAASSPANRMGAWAATIQRVNGGGKKKKQVAQDTKTVTSAPKATTTAAPKNIVTSAPQSTATAAPKNTATAAPKNTVTAAPKNTATAAPKNTATAAPKNTTTAAPKTSITAAPKNTTTVAPKNTAAATPKNTKDEKQVQAIKAEISMEQADVEHWRSTIKAYSKGEHIYSGLKRGQLIDLIAALEGSVAARTQVHSLHKDELGETDKGNHQQAIDWENNKLAEAQKDLKSIVWIPTVVTDLPKENKNDPDLEWVVEAHWDREDDYNEFERLKVKPGEQEWSTQKNQKKKKNNNNNNYY